MSQQIIVSALQKNIVKVIGIVFFTSVLLLVVSTCLICYVIDCTSMEREQVILIKKGSTTMQVAKMLADDNIIKDPIGFYILAKIYCRLNNKQILAGEYQLKTIQNALDMIWMFTEGKIIQHKLTIPQGFTIKQAIERIHNLENIRHFPSIATLAEGSILPETYFYTHSTTDIELIKRMQDAMQEFVMTEWEKRDIRIDNIIESPEQAITLASIVEKETYIDSEKPLIAGVYLNRLKKKMRLQADPTVIYGLEMIEDEKWNNRRRVLYSHLRQDSDYNTYIRHGLPPTPICNPGRKSIVAVLHPKWTQELFFVANSNGEHVFARNFSQHKLNARNIRSVR